MTTRQYLNPLGPLTYGVKSEVIGALSERSSLRASGQAAPGTGTKCTLIYDKKPV